MNSMMFPLLFSPLELGHITLPNRICFLAHRTNLARDGRISDRLSAYYERRAKGGCGLIILGEISIHPHDRPYEAMIEAYHPEARRDLIGLSDRLHNYGTRVFAQITHHGFQSSGAISREPIWGPSALCDIVHGETAKAMEQEDMKILLKAFAEAAVMAREGGMDGIEIDMGPESLLRQFLSPLSNYRRDEYGGGLENRIRFPLQAVESVRQAVGQDFTVGIRLCVDEKLPWGGIQVTESLQFAQQFTSGGHVDFIGVSIGTYYNLHLVLASMHTPLGLTVDLAEQVTKHVNVPVMASYLIHSPQRAEDILSEGKADMAGFVRPLICDPDFPIKARNNRPEDIRYCVRDNKGCVGRVTQLRTIGCIQNPEAGREGEVRGQRSEVRAEENPNCNSCLNPELRTSNVAKRVMVIGAGPAGLEAARAARERGHEVKVYERMERVGGPGQSHYKEAWPKGHGGRDPLSHPHAEQTGRARHDRGPCYG